MAILDFNGEEKNGQGIHLPYSLPLRNSTPFLGFINYCKEMHELQ
jgi:hypothetical protein